MFWCDSTGWKPRSRGGVRLGRRAACWLSGAFLLTLPVAAADLLSGVPSDSLNRELPGWLRLSGEERVRVEGMTGIGYKQGVDDFYLLNRLRLNLRMPVTSWFRAVFQAQDARVAGNNVRPAPTSQKDTMDLRIGYVEFGNNDEAPFGLRVGRQSLKLGDGRLVWDPAWSNVGRAFDAALVTARIGFLRLDAFGGSVVRPKSEDFDVHRNGDDLYGLYATAKPFGPGQSLETYLIGRSSSGYASEKGVAGMLWSRTLGVRWAGKLRRGFDGETEMAKQWGRQSSDKLGAWAGHWRLRRAFAAPLSPSVFVEYNYASGDPSAGDGRRGAFDIIYPTAHDRYGLVDQFVWSNLKHVRVNAEFRPHKLVTLGGAYHDFRLADPHDALYGASAKVIARDTKGRYGAHIGQEADIQANWRTSRVTQIGAGYGRIFPGEFLRRAISGHAYNLFYLSMAREF
jgi:hypothetical protein